MEEKINALLEKVGRPYEMFNEDETYQGCFYPFQFLYPEVPRYKMRSRDDDKNYWYGLSKIKKHCMEIQKEELRMGDMIVTRFNDELHVGIFYQFGKIIHVFKGHTLQIGRLKMFSEFQSFRVML